MPGASAVTSGEFGAFAPIGAVKTASGYDVAWKMASADGYTVWSTDNNVISQSDRRWCRGPPQRSKSFEPIFNQDLNGDGMVGLFVCPSSTLLIRTNRRQRRSGLDLSNPRPWRVFGARAFLLLISPVVSESDAF